MAAIAVALVVIAGVVGLAVASTPSTNGSVKATAFDLPRLGSSGRVKLADYRGTPVVVNLFASWCPECRVELPDFHNAAVKLKGKLQFVFVNSNETGDGRGMAEQYHLPDFPVAADTGGSAGNGLYRQLGGTGGMPMTAFYDASGHLLGVVRGSMPDASLREGIFQTYGLKY